MASEWCQSGFKIFSFTDDAFNYIFFVFLLTVSTGSNLVDNLHLGCQIFVVQLLSLHTCYNFCHCTLRMSDYRMCWLQLLHWTGTYWCCQIWFLSRPEKAYRYFCVTCKCTLPGFLKKLEKFLLASISQILNFANFKLSDIHFSFHLEQVVSFFNVH